jgi:DNA-binding NtrC family response regulator
MARRSRLLVVDDKPNFLALFRRIARDEFDVLTASDAADALGILGQEQVDVIVSDVKMPGLGGLDLLMQVKTRYPDVEFILMTAFAHVPDAVKAMKAGAFHYLTKPFDPDVALALIREALAKRGSTDPERLADENAERRLIAASSAMQVTLDVIASAAPIDVTVLIRGESGAGKEAVARELHARSERSNGPFIAASCVALPDVLIEAELFGVVEGALAGKPPKDGLFQQASGGVLFLDEITDLSLPTQAKLLRVLQERAVRRVGGAIEEAVNVRIVVASSANVEQRVAEGSFREDLFYRLNVISIRIPALRERREDIRPLTESLLARMSLVSGARSTISAEAVSALENYEWPGNVRQLENVIAHAAVIAAGQELSVAMLPEEVRRETHAREEVDLSALPYREVLAHTRDRSSKEYFVALLKAVQGNVTQAAERAGLERESLHRLLKRYGLRAEDFRTK